MFYSPAFAIQNQNIHMSWRKRKEEKKADTHSLSQSAFYKQRQLQWKAHIHSKG